MISKIIACTAFLAFMCSVFVPEIKAQKRAPKPKDVWYLSFDVTIKGGGQKTSGNDNELVVTWSIDRAYSGVVELNFSVPQSVYVNKNMKPAEIAARMNAAPVVWHHRGIDTAHSFLPVKVKIHDWMVTMLKGGGEGTSFENRETSVRWDGEGTALADDTVTLMIHMGKSMYNVTIPLILHLNDNLLTKKTKHTIDRSKFGYGGAPTHEEIPVAPEELPLGEFGFPKVIALLKDGTIHHPNDLPLELVNGGYDWDSGDQDIDEPLIKGFPESRKGIKIHVYYLFKKMAAK